MGNLGSHDASAETTKDGPDPSTVTSAVESKQLYGRGVTGCGCQAGVTREQSSAEFFGKRDIGRIIGREVVPELPDAGQQNEVGIADDAQVEQVLDSLIRALG